MDPVESHESLKVKKQKRQSEIQCRDTGTEEIRGRKGGQRELKHENDSICRCELKMEEGGHEPGNLAAIRN